MLYRQRKRLDIATFTATISEIGKKIVFFAFFKSSPVEKIPFAVYSIAGNVEYPGGTVMKKYSKYQFTLIELLAVIGLLALLIGIFVPAFNRIMFSSKVDQAASVFKTGLEVAQSKAASARKHVAMILPTKYDEISDDKLKPYCNGGYRLAYVKKQDDGKWVFNGWVPGSGWSNMSDGAMLVALERGKDWWDNGGKFKDLPSVADKTDQAISGAGNLTDIYVTEDTQKEDVDADLNGLRAADATGKTADNWKGVILTPYGGAVGGDTPLLFFFTEAQVNDSAYEYQNKDNFLVLKLNPITGKVVYLAMEDDEDDE